MDKKIVIKFDDISKKYDANYVIENFNLDIFEGDFVTIIGSSGCGKTTAIKMINGLNTPTSGNIFVNEENIKTINQDFLRRDIGYVIQSIGLFPHMTIKENISYVPKLKKIESKKIEKMIEEIMNVVNLPLELLKKYPHELSGGQKQRVGIARALVGKPKIILMDEPFGAVDEITRTQLQEEILRIKNQLDTTIVFITHDIREALKLGSRVIVLKNGNIEQDDTPENIINFPKTDFVQELTSSYVSDRN